MDARKKPFPWRLDAGQIEIVDEAVAAILRTKTPAERIALGLQAHQTATLMLTTRVRSQHADWTDAQIHAEVARRLLLGPD